MSGAEWPSFFISEYLVVEGLDTVFEIRFEYSPGPFKDVVMHDGKLAVGHGEHFYLFDVHLEKLLLKLEMELYFGYIYLNKGLLYVADACGLFCITTQGDITWESKGLGYDGVVVNEFTGHYIKGEGEFDPPGGWEPFVLDIRNGNKLEI